MKNPVLIWEIAGVFVVFMFGALLHFVFEWSGELAFVGAVASVNESVWEHFKQGFWPMFFYALVEYRYLRIGAGKLLVAKAVAVYLLPIFTGLVFYAYTAVTGEEILLVDIIIFLVAIIIGQFVSYRILRMSQPPRYMVVTAATAIVLLAVILVVFTYFPPHLPIFMDPSGSYGIP